jgi:mono/diheme cytochrome c family protein
MNTNIDYPLLLILAMLTSAPVATVANAQPTEASWEGTPQQEFLAGPTVRKFQCVTCHTITDAGGTVGPILNLVGLRRSAEWLDRWLKNPNAVKPGTKMPKFPFTEEERELAVSYLSKMKRPLRSEEILASGKPAVEQGRELFVDYDCFACHRIGNEGRFVGPDLTWVGIRKPETWERIWLTSPPDFKPDTFMPDFHIPPEAVRSLAAYLHTLQGQDNAAGRQWEFMFSFMVNTTPMVRGEMVWKRLGCWSCHGENGKGGIQNPNAAPGHETVPDLKSTRDKYDQATFLGKIKSGTKTPAADSKAVPQPYECPAYPEEALNQQGLDDLYAFISSLAPPKSRWSIQ